MIKLNEKQQKLVNDNHNLIYDYAYRKNLDIDTYYDILATGLCLAAFYYDKEKAKFSTLAYKCMTTEIQHLYRYSHRQRSIPNNSTIQLDTPVAHSDDGSRMTYADCITDMSENTETQVCSKMTIQDILTQYTPDKQKIIKLYLLGYSQTDVGKMVGKTKSRVNHIIIQFKDLCRQKML